MKFVHVGTGKVNDKVENLYTKSQIVEMLKYISESKKEIAQAFFDGNMEEAGNGYLDEGLAIERIAKDIDLWLA